MPSRTATLVFLFAMFPIATFAAPTAGPRDVPPQHWAGGSVRRVVHENIMGTTKDGRFLGNQPVTRYELAVALDRFVRYIEAGRKPLHVETFPAPVKIPATASTVQRQALTHLITNGFLPANSPLVVKNGSGLVTAQETSDALASVTIRLSDRAEAPDKN